MDEHYSFVHILTFISTQILAETYSIISQSYRSLCFASCTTQPNKNRKLIYYLNAKIGYEEGDGKFIVDDYVVYESGPQKPLTELSQSPLLVLVSGLDQVNHFYQIEFIN